MAALHAGRSARAGAYTTCVDATLLAKRIGRLEGNLAAAGFAALQAAGEIGRLLS
jgi:hypothetical protein